MLKKNLKKKILNIPHTLRVEVENKKKLKKKINYRFT